MINPHKYDGLEISPAARELMESDPERFKRCCNGVGSKVGFLAKLVYHIIPNTIWFMSIKEAADLHDVDYSVPQTFKTKAEALEYKRQADFRFYMNVVILIKRRGGYFERWRRRRAFVYYETLRLAGEASFLAGKIIEQNV
jgi:hypothetical protein